MVFGSWAALASGAWNVHDRGTMFTAKERERETMGFFCMERKRVAAEVLMATPCTNSLGGESGGQKHEGCAGRSACWKYAAVSGSLFERETEHLYRERERVMAREFYLKNPTPPGTAQAI